MRDWLTQSWPARAPGVLCDDEHITGATPLSFEVTTSEVTTLFSSGAEVAFHVRQTGRYLGGLPGLAAGSHEAVLHCNGIVKVEDGAVVSGRVIRDRAGLRGSLLKS